MTLSTMLNTFQWMVVPQQQHTMPKFKTWAFAMYVVSIVLVNICSYCSFQYGETFVISGMNMKLRVDMANLLCSKQPFC